MRQVAGRHDEIGRPRRTITQFTVGHMIDRRTLMFAAQSAIFAGVQRVRVTGAAAGGSSRSFAGVASVLMRVVSYDVVGRPPA